MREKLLFVCTANVCRSPLMEFTFVADADLEGWNAEVASAGLGSTTMSRMCDVASGVIADTDGAGDFASNHRPTRLTLDVLDAQDMVITPGRPERGRLARLQPAARARSFSLGEAISLGGAPFTSDEITRMRDSQGESSPNMLRLYAEALNGRRGRIAVDERPSRRFPWTSPAVPSDFPDVHASRRSQHVRTLKSLHEAVRQFQHQLESFRSASL